MNLVERLRPYVGYIALALAAGLFWSVVRFPYDALAQRIAWGIGNSGKLQMSYESAGPALLPPGLVYRNVTFKTVDGRPFISAATVKMRPVWWRLFTGRLGFVVQADMLGGGVRVYALGDALTAPANFDVDLSLAALNLNRHPPLAQSKVVGTVDGEGKFRAVLGKAGLGLNGQADLAIKGLSVPYASPLLAKPAVGVAQAKAKLRLIENRLVFEEFKLGPGDLEGTMSGEILLNADIPKSPLLVRGSVVLDPGLLKPDALGGPGSIMGDLLRNKRPLPVNYRGTIEGLGRMGQ